MFFSSWTFYHAFRKPFWDSSWGTYSVACPIGLVDGTRFVKNECSSSHFRSVYRQRRDSPFIWLFKIRFFLVSIKQTNGNALVSTLTELRVFQTIRTTFPSGGRHLCFVDIHRHFFYCGLLKYKTNCLPVGLREYRR